MLHHAGLAIKIPLLSEFVFGPILYYFHDLPSTKFPFAFLIKGGIVS